MSVKAIFLLAVICLTFAQAQSADYQTGQQLNAASRYSDAAESLEAAILRAPDDRRIQLEYAIALAGSGDLASAQQLLQQLRNDPALDAATRRQIDALIKQSWLHAYLPALPKGSISLMIGHDDNFLGAPHQGAFELTLPEGSSLLVTPADGQKPHAGFFTRADLRLDGALPGGLRHAQPLRYGMFLNLSKTAGQIADRNHWGLLLEKQHLLFPGSYFQAAHQQLNVQASPLYRQTLLGTGLALAGTAWGQICRT
ncbi:MAG: tetratricopeptide repeat protein, partial [Deltaproteobacteria bacterium]|nr:tetratricopeptide repeat protein [Deltaproteobacteria bacterium]